jgi:hypothetical protein
MAEAALRHCVAAGDLSDGLLALAATATVPGGHTRH